MKPSSRPPSGGVRPHTRWRRLGEVLVEGQGSYAEHKNLCVWAKTNGGMGSLYRSQHELVVVFKSGKGPHINNVELGKHGKRCCQATWAA